MYLQATNMHILGTESKHGHVILFMAIVLIGIVSYSVLKIERGSVVLNYISFYVNVK